ncbi:hypothetical protein WN718_004414 [Salmonella enterica]|nr:hypothetical protein [Salmonella enterica subsp. enterica serovar Hvittingfoss]EHI5926476.1 hypothetical protein [Salmonella enterica]MLV53160.1 hypothetical protein [Salmonella enterica subsp. enterica serovar Hvittingfoss]
MTTITREEVKAFIEQIESDLSNGWEAQIFELKLARIALASLDAEPVAWTSEGALAEVYCGETGVIGPKYIVGDIPLYRHAQPAPVVPEEIPKGLAGQIVSLLAHNIGDKFLAQKIWNACRAALLQGNQAPVKQPSSNSENVPVISDGWVMVPVELTDDMIAAAMNCDDVLFNRDESFCVQFGNIYAAMIAAAPQQEVK